MLQSAVGVAASASRVREDEILAIEPSDELTMVLEAKVDFILRDRRTLSFKLDCCRGGHNTHIAKHDLNLYTHGSPNLRNATMAAQQEGN